MDDNEYVPHTQVGNKVVAGAGITVTGSGLTKTIAVTAGSIGPTQLADTAVTPGAYTNANITVDADGRITAAASNSGDVPSTRLVSAGTGLSGGGDLSADRTIAVAAGGIGPTQLAVTAVTAGSYVNANATVDAQGRITAMSSPIASGSPDGSVTGVAGQMYTDSATGVRWQNTNGATAWDPIFIPPKWGTSFFDDILATTPLVFTSIGAGSTSATSTAGLPGQVTTSQSVAGVDGVAANIRAGSLLYGGGVARTRIAFRITTLSDSTNNIVCRIGSGDVTTFADVVDGVYYEYDFSTYGDHNWRICASSNSTRTKTDTGIVAVAQATAFTSFSLTVNAAGTSLTGTIGGVAVATPVTTNIPTGAGRQTSPVYMMTQKQLGAGALTAAIDWVDFYQIFSSVRA